jgi:hypothetical protein
MLELILNLHMPYPYSDGTVSRKEIVAAAMKDELNAVMVTDQFISGNGFGEYYQEGNHLIVITIIERIQAQTCQSQDNHFLVFNAG